MDITHAFRCTCFTPDHTLLVTKDDDFTYFEILLSKDYSFIKRLKLAYKYLFKKETITYTETLLNPEEVHRLIDLLQITTKV